MHDTIAGVQKEKSFIRKGGCVTRIMKAIEMKRMKLDLELFYTLNTLALLVSATRTFTINIDSAIHLSTRPASFETTIFSYHASLPLPSHIGIPASFLHRRTYP